MIQNVPVHPGSGSWFFTHPGPRIQGSNRHRIPDLHVYRCLIGKKFGTEKRNDTQAERTQFKGLSGVHVFVKNGHPRLKADAIDGRSRCKIPFYLYHLFYAEICVLFTPVAVKIFKASVDVIIRVLVRLDQIIGVTHLLAQWRT